MAIRLSATKSGSNMWDGIPQHRVTFLQTSKHVAVVAIIFLAHFSAGLGLKYINSMCTSATGNKKLLYFLFQREEGKSWGAGDLSMRSTG